MLCLTVTFAWLAPIGAPCARAQPIVDLTRPVNGTPLGPSLSLLEDESRDLLLEDVLAPERAARFSRSREEVPGFGFTSSAYWLRFTVDNARPSPRRWLLELAYPHLDDVTLYVQRADGGFDVRMTGDYRPFALRDLAYHNFVFTLEEPAHTRRTYYLRVASSGSVNLPLLAWDIERFLEHQPRELGAFFLFYGALLVMACYNLFAYFLIRQTEYLHYVLFIFASGMLQFTLAGHTFQFLLPDQIWLNHQMTPWSIALALCSACRVASAYLSLETSLPKVDRAARCFGLSCLGLAILITPGAHALQVKVLTTVFGLVSLVFVVGCIYLVRQGAQRAKSYLVGWAGVIVGFGVFWLKSNGILPTNLFTSWSCQIGMTVQLVLVSSTVAERIHAMRAHLSVLNLDLSSKVVALQSALMRAEDASAQAEQAMRVKDEFMATMSHELRTPLNTIINVPQGLLQDFPHDEVLGCVHCQSMFELEPGDQVSSGTACPECGKLQSFEVKTLARYTGRPERTAHYLAMIERSGKHLLHMVNGILDFSKMEAGRLSLTLERFDAGKLIQEVVDEMGPYAERAGVQLAIERLPLAASLTADPVRIKQVLMNLLSNAVKFSERGSVVSVGGEGVPEGYHFFVKDRGIGIAAEHFERIFESFEQVHKGNTRNYGGTGLGLSISRSLVRMHGGEMWVASELGKGSTFFFRIPSARPNLQPVTGVRELSRELPELNPNEELAS